MSVRQLVLVATLVTGAITGAPAPVWGEPPAAPKAGAPVANDKDKEDAVRLARLRERLRQYAKHRESLTTRCGACQGMGRIRNPIASVYDKNLKTEIPCTSCEGTGIRVSSTAVSRILLTFRSPKTANIEGSIDTKTLTASYQSDPKSLKTLRPTSYELVDLVLLPPNLGRGVIRRSDGPDEEHRWIWVATGGAGSAAPATGDWYFFDARVDDVWPFPSLFARAGKYPVVSDYDRFEDVTRTFVNDLATDQPDHRLSAVWFHSGKTLTTPPTIVRLVVTRVGPDWKYVKSHAVAAIADGVRIAIGDGTPDQDPLPKGEVRETVVFDVPTETFLIMAGATRELVFRVGTQELQIPEEERIALKEFAVTFPKEPLPPK